MCAVEAVPQRRNSGEDGEPEASFGKTFCAATPLMRTARARPIRKCCTRCGCKHRYWDCGHSPPRSHSSASPAQKL